MAFTYQRTIRFADTDAAGVVFFANFFAICHEAYEEALAVHGINLQRFFSDTATIVPISKSEAEYLRPLQAGDKVRVTVRPERLTDESFRIHYEVVRLGPPEKVAARVRTEHVATSPEKRTRVPVPPALAAWVAAG